MSYASLKEFLWMECLKERPNSLTSLCIVHDSTSNLATCWFDNATQIISQKFRCVRILSCLVWLQEKTHVTWDQHVVYHRLVLYIRPCITSDASKQVASQPCINLFFDLTMCTVQKPPTEIPSWPQTHIRMKLLQSQEQMLLFNANEWGPSHIDMHRKIWLESSMISWRHHWDNKIPHCPLFCSSSCCSNCSSGSRSQELHQQGTWGNGSAVAGLSWHHIT